MSIISLLLSFIEEKYIKELYLIRIYIIQKLDRLKNHLFDKNSDALVFIL